MSPILFMTAMAFNGLPNHVAIIMDGNGRWAKQRHLNRSYGHIEGVKRVEEIVKAAHQMGIKVLTIYAFSTENWNRPADEVSMLMSTLINALNQKIRNLHDSGICVKFIGRRTGVPDAVLSSMDAAETLTKANAGMVLNIAFNYGARVEIIDAIKTIAQAISNKQMAVDDIDEEAFSRALYTAGQPDPDLLIRTSGEKRISNFLLWQLSYAELYLTEKYWPEFTSQEFKKAIDDYQGRQRRYGAVDVKSIGK